MDLKQLYYVVTIAKAGTMTQAAKDIHISQSALSFSYRNLEDELGVVLFEKRGRNLILTPAGRLFCEKAAAILAQVDDLKVSVDQYSASRLNRISIAAEAVDVGSEAMLRYSVVFPELSMEVLRPEADEVVDMLMCGRADLALTLRPMEDAAVSSELLMDERMLVLVPGDSPLAREREISISVLRGLPLVTQKDNYYMSDLIDGFYRQAWVLPGVRNAVGDPETIPYQVSRGSGVGFIPESVYYAMKENELSSCVALPVSEEFCRRQVYLTLPKNGKLSPNCQRFIQFLRHFAALAQAERRFPDLEQLQF